MRASGRCAEDGVVAIAILPSQVFAEVLQLIFVCVRCQLEENHDQLIVLLRLRSVSNLIILHFILLRRLYSLEVCVVNNTGIQRRCC